MGYYEVSIEVHQLYKRTILVTNVDNSGANTVDNNNKAMCVRKKRVCEKSLPDSVFLKTSIFSKKNVKKFLTAIIVSLEVNTTCAKLRA